MSEGGSGMADRPKTVQDVRTLVDELSIEFVFAQFVEMYGKANAKLVPAAHLEDLFAEGAGFAGFAAGEIGQGPHNPDLAAMPDPASFTPVPWQPNLSRFACDIHVEGEEWPYCPRTILRRQLDRARSLGYVFKMGMEAEFFLARRTDDGRLEVADPLDTLDRPCYDMKALSRQFDFISALSKYETQLGWDNYANDHEDANGQFESNFVYDDALTTADRIIFFRYMVHSLAQQRGLQATFMPKPFAHLTGNGLHMHMSLWDAETDTSLFEAENDPRGLGLSETAYYFLGGLLKHASAYIGVTASTVNSYKRLIVGAPTSGATWAPVYITYGRNNRTQMIRVPAPGRFEDRTIDGAANPYLAATVVLAAGLDGIENKIDPGEPNEGNMYEVPEAELGRRGIDILPGNLLDATRNLQRDEVLRQALGRAVDEDYIDYYVQVKQREWKEYHDRVSDWEVDRYLALF
jgi:glutamine synthetase